MGNNGSALHKSSFNCSIGNHVDYVVAPGNKYGLQHPNHPHRYSAGVGAGAARRGPSNQHGPPRHIAVPGLGPPVPVGYPIYRPHSVLGLNEDEALQHHAFHGGGGKIKYHPADQYHGPSRYSPNQSYPDGKKGFIKHGSKGKQNAGRSRGGRRAADKVAASGGGQKILPSLPRSHSFHNMLRATENGQILAQKGTIRGNFFNESKFTAIFQRKNAIKQGGSVSASPAPSSRISSSSSSNNNHVSSKVKSKAREESDHLSVVADSELNAILRARRCKSETNLFVDLDQLESEKNFNTDSKLITPIEESVTHSKVSVGGKVSSNRTMEQSTNHNVTNQQQRCVAVKLSHAPDDHLLPAGKKNGATVDGSQSAISNSKQSKSSTGNTGPANSSAMKPMSRVHRTKCRAPPPPTQASKTAPQYNLNMNMNDHCNESSLQSSNPLIKSTPTAHTSDSHNIGAANCNRLPNSCNTSSQNNVGPISHASNLNVKIINDQSSEQTNLNCSKNIVTNGSLGSNSSNTSSGVSSGENCNSRKWNPPHNMTSDILMDDNNLNKFNVNYNNKEALKGKKQQQPAQQDLSPKVLAGQLKKDRAAAAAAADAKKQAKNEFRVNVVSQHPKSNGKSKSGSGTKSTNNQTGNSCGEANDAKTSPSTAGLIRRLSEKAYNLATGSASNSQVSGSGGLGGGSRQSAKKDKPPQECHNDRPLVFDSSKALVNNNRKNPIDKKSKKNKSSGEKEFQEVTCDLYQDDSNSTLNAAAHQCHTREREQTIPDYDHIFFAKPITYFENFDVYPTSSSGGHSEAAKNKNRGGGGGSKSGSAVNGRNFPVMDPSAAELAFGLGYTSGIGLPPAFDDNFILRRSTPNAGLPMGTRIQSHQALNECCDSVNDKKKSSDKGYNKWGDVYHEFMIPQRTCPTTGLFRESINDPTNRPSHRSDAIHTHTIQVNGLPDSLNSSANSNNSGSKYIADSANYSDEGDHPTSVEGMVGEDEEAGIQLVIRPALPPPPRRQLGPEDLIIREDIFNLTSNVDHKALPMWTPLHDLSSDDEERDDNHASNRRWRKGDFIEDECDDGIHCSGEHSPSDEDPIQGPTSPSCRMCPLVPPTISHHNIGQDNYHHKSNHNLDMIMPECCAVHPPRFTLKNQLKTLVDNNFALRHRPAF